MFDFIVAVEQVAIGDLTKYFFIVSLKIKKYHRKIII